MELEVDIEEPWPPADWPALAVRSAEAAAQVAPELGNPRLSASLLLTSDAEVHALNREWRERIERIPAERQIEAGEPVAA